MARSHAITWLRDTDSDEKDRIGTKSALLSELFLQNLPIPDGFIITADAYFQYLKENHLTTKINHLLNTVNFQEPTSILQVSSHIQKLIREGTLPETLHKEIITAYRKLGGSLTDPIVILRSSATLEKLPLASFAGQQKSGKNIQGDTNIIMTIKDIWMSLFEPRAIFYRHEKGYDHFRLGISVIVQPMLSPDVSGTLFTNDPITSDTGILRIEAQYGAGDTARKGEVMLDVYQVDKKSLTITKKEIVEQETAVENSHGQEHIVTVPPKARNAQKLSDTEIQSLAELGKKVEKHLYFPQEISWILSQGKIYLLNSRPITPRHEEKTTDAPKKGVMTGAPGTPGIATGHVAIVQSKKDLASVRNGDILVVDKVKPEYAPALRKAAGVISEKTAIPEELHRTRLLGIPIVSGVKEPKKALRPGALVTMNGNKGEIVLGGFRTFSGVKQNKTVTKISLAVTDRPLMDVASLPIDGIGLLPSDVLIRDIGIHPKKMLRDGKSAEWKDMLTERIVTHASSVRPLPVMYRTANLTSDQYRLLTGGKALEPVETNPLLGYRGGLRSLHDPDVFALELEAVKAARDTYSCRNIQLILPFVRSVRELLQLKKLILAAGLHRSGSFTIWLSADTPATVIQIEAFMKAGIDGVAIDGDTLAALLLGIDPQNSEVSGAFNEHDDALLQAIKFAITTAQKYNLPISLYGQTLAHSPAFIEQLVEWGISGVTVPETAIENVRKTIYKYERRRIM